MQRYLICSLFLFLNLYSVEAQTGFQFPKDSPKKVCVDFQMIHNLIVIPLVVNGKEVSFILDTGVDKTILFNFLQNDSIPLQDVQKTTLKGLGSGLAVSALISKNNHLSLQGISSKQETVYVLLKDSFDISGKMGVTIHGVIGYNLLKSVVLKIDYNKQQVTFYNPKTYTFPTCKKCEVFPLEMHRKKPYINVVVQLDTLGKQQTPVKLLVDIGGSDALWLFENSKNIIQTPQKYFKDILGEGLSGTVYGNRSRIPSLTLGRFNIPKPTVSFLDTTSTFHARVFKARNGSLGGAVLKRFDVWIDYRHKKMMLKKTSSLKKPFYYNMSGLAFVYNGKKLVRDSKVVQATGSFGARDQHGADQLMSFVTNYSYRFEQAYKIGAVVSESPAGLSGVLKGDELIRINGVQVEKYTLGELNALMQVGPNRRIKLLILRKGKRMRFQFRLQKRI